MTDIDEMVRELEQRIKRNKEMLNSDEYEFRRGRRFRTTGIWK